ncbi:conjugal transfer protein TraD [Sphingopyxis sp. Geo25]|uniref:conjugal transfer protein TraD n=1 Tax=Sphingopyxis sp. Geo25 TaxID=3032247 RepID=UPI0024B6A936|nr:conjugal transfer protein TraD [Sphingopyxis sp. Geo25]
MKRRERTRQLIELGGLVAKAKLVDLTGDDRPAIFGLLLEAAAKLGGDAREAQLQLWHRRGSRAFALEAEERVSTLHTATPVQSLSQEFGS